MPGARASSTTVRAASGRAHPRTHDDLDARPLELRQRGADDALAGSAVRRSLDIDPLQCSRCGGRMRLISTLFWAEVVEAVLRSLGLPTEAPGIRPPRGPPEAELVEIRWN